MWYWLAVVPVAIELVWLATYVPKLRRWREAQDEIEQKQGLRPDPVEHLDFVYMVVTTRLARDGRARLAQADIGWAGRYFAYHIPAILLLSAVAGPVPNPLMGFGWRTALTMAVTAAAYGGLCLLAARLVG
jgi:hypothetical protein